MSEQPRLVALIAAVVSDIRQHARQTLADYKVPERVHFLPALPKGPTGKVHRKALKDTLAGTGPSAASQ